MGMGWGGTRRGAASIWRRRVFLQVLVICFGFCVGCCFLKLFNCVRSLMSSSMSGEGLRRPESGNGVSSRYRISFCDGVAEKHVRECNIVLRDFLQKISDFFQCQKQYLLEGGIRYTAGQFD